MFINVSYRLIMLKNQLILLDLQFATLITLLQGEATIMYRDGSHSKANFDNQGVLDGLNVRFWCKFGACNEFELEAWRKPRHIKEISIYNKGKYLTCSYHFCEELSINDVFSKGEG